MAELAWDYSPRSGDLTLFNFHFPYLNPSTISYYSPIWVKGSLRIFPFRVNSSSGCIYTEQIAQIEGLNPSTQLTWRQ